MAAEYVTKHQLARTIETALTEALASQPENPYQALATWFEAKPRAAVAAGKPFKLLAIDLDGTTVAENEDMTGSGEEEVFPGTVEAALEYQEAGGHLVVATGRPYGGGVGMAIKLGCDKHAGLMVCGNGATVHDLNAAEPAKSLAERATLRADTLSGLYRTLLQHMPELMFGVKQEGANKFMYNAPKEEGILKFLADCVDEKTFKAVSTFTFENTVGVEEYSTFLESYPQSLVSPDSIFVWHFGMSAAELSAALRPAMEEFLAATGQKLHVANLKMMHGRTDGTDGGFLTIDDDGDDITSKATGLKIVCKRLGLSAADVLAIGNDTNDLEMFDWAGHSVCMPHANEESKRAATEVSELDFDQGAVAEELRQATARLKESA